MIPIQRDADARCRYLQFINKYSVPLRGIVITGARGTTPVLLKQILLRGKRRNTHEASLSTADLLNIDQPPPSTSHPSAWRSDWQPRQPETLRRAALAADCLAFHLHCSLKPPTHKFLTRVVPQGTATPMESAHAPSDSKGMKEVYSPIISGVF